MQDRIDKIKKMLLFFLFIFIIIFLFCKVSWLFRGNSSENRKNLVGLKNQGKIDVVLFGGSNLLRYYEPLEAWRDKGFTSYNYATYVEKLDIMKEYIEQSRYTNKAKLYICDIRTITLVDKMIDEPSLRNWSDSLPILSPARLKGISSFLFTRDWQDSDVLSFYLDILKYHSNLETLGNQEQWSYVDLDNVYSVDKGFNPYESHVPFDEPELTETRGTLTEQQRNAMIKLLDYCDRENLDVLFICCPYVIPKSECEIINSCEDMIRERGYDFVNFNNYYDKIGFDFETDFGDKNHVNYLGAEKYTHYLINYLSDNYKLTDHRGDGYYERWNTDYSNYVSNKKLWKTNITNLVDRHLEAKNVGERLSQITDINDWLYNIRNSNFTLLIEKDEQLNWNFNNEVTAKLISDWNIDMSQQYYIGVWSGDSCEYANNGTDEFKGEIGVDGGRGMMNCKITAEKSPQISIETVNYRKKGRGVHVVVFDNNYQSVVDSVNIVETKNGFSIER